MFLLPYKFIYYYLEDFHISEGRQKKPDKMCPCGRGLLRFQLLMLIRPSMILHVLIYMKSIITYQCVYLLFIIHLFIIYIVLMYLLSMIYKSSTYDHLFIYYLYITCLSSLMYGINIHRVFVYLYHI